jgi:hypothetical protein
VSGGPRVAPAGGEQSRAESLTLVGRCGGITQACQYTSPTVLRGFFLLGGLAGYLDVPRRPATGGVSKNLRQRSQADTDSWHGLFDTQADPVEGVFSLSKKRALFAHRRTLRKPLAISIVYATRHQHVVAFSIVIATFCTREDFFLVLWECSDRDNLRPFVS